MNFILLYTSRQNSTASEAGLQEVDDEAPPTTPPTTAAASVEATATAAAATAEELDKNILVLIKGEQSAVL